MVRLRLVRLGNTHPPENDPRRRASLRGPASPGLTAWQPAATCYGFVEKGEQIYSETQCRHRLPGQTCGRPDASCSQPFVPGGTSFRSAARISFSSVAPGGDNSGPIRSVNLRGGCFRTWRPRERRAVDPYPVHDDGKPSRQCHPRLSLGRALDQVQCPGPKGTGTARACHDGVGRLIQIGPHQAVSALGNRAAPIDLTGSILARRETEKCTNVA